MLKILLPTDFSDNAQQAINYAVRLLEKEECLFYVLHAYHDAPSAAKNRIDLENDLKDLVETIPQREHNPKHQFKAIFIIDSLVNALNITMIDKAIDYIFMGTKGVTSLFNVFMGSNTVRVIKQLDNCPIMAIPAGYDFVPPEQIAFANNFEHRFMATELVPLIKITQLWDSTVSVINISSRKALDAKQKQNREELKDLIGGIKTSFREVQMGVSIASTLYQLEKENPKLGILALLKTKHGFFESLLHEPVLRTMAFNTEVPLLILPQID